MDGADVSGSEMGAPPGCKRAAQLGLAGGPDWVGAAPAGGLTPAPPGCKPALACVPGATVRPAWALPGRLPARLCAG